MIFVYIAIGLIVIIGLKYIDIKRNYDNIPIFKCDMGNGEFYFSVPFYIWQGNKVKKAKELYTQNSILEVNGYKYQIRNFGGAFAVPNGVFFERELRYWGEPLRIVWSNSNPQVTINQYGSGDISVTLNNNQYMNDIVNIQEYISQDTHIDGTDKELMQDFIDKVINGRSMGTKEVKNAYDTFLRYEPLLSFALNFFSVIKGFFVK